MIPSIWFYFARILNQGAEGLGQDVSFQLLEQSLQLRLCYP